MIPEHTPDGLALTVQVSPTIELLANQRAVASVLRAPLGMGAARAFIRGDAAIRCDPLEALGAEAVLAGSAGLLASRILPFVLRHPQLLRHLTAVGPLEMEYGTHWWERGGRGDRIGHHYDLDPEFFRSFLGPTMVYSGCDLDTQVGLDASQQRKIDLILDALPEGELLVDIGCGWGTLLLQAARSGKWRRVIGVTAARAQAAYIRKLMAVEQLQRVELVVGDALEWMTATSERPVAISAIGVYEHLAERDPGRFFRAASRIQPSGSRLVLQSIYRSERHRSTIRRHGFIQRTIFPEGRLWPSGTIHNELRSAGYEPLTQTDHSVGYADTLAEWRRALGEAEAQMSSHAEVHRAYMLYLLGAESRFRAQQIGLLRVVAQVH